MTTSLFISDLHLSEATPRIEQGLYRFLEQKGGVDRLFLLGDIFEAWIGDDDDSPLAQRFTSAMKQMADRGTRIYFMRGNRDFLVGTDYLGKFSAELLSDMAQFVVAGEHTLIMHGDLLCTDDTDYMAFRTVAHDPAWQADMLAKPLEERRELAKQLRTMSKEAASNKAEDIMDVNQAAIERAVTQHSVSRLIHGHTHRPGRHSFENFERVVLGDWNETGWYLHEHGNALELVEFDLEALAS